MMTCNLTWQIENLWVGRLSRFACSHLLKNQNNFTFELWPPLAKTNGFEARTLLIVYALNRWRWWNFSRYYRINQLISTFDIFKSEAGYWFYGQKIKSYDFKTVSNSLFSTAATINKAVTAPLND
jgi:hypothetical protein